MIRYKLYWISLPLSQDNEDYDVPRHSVPQQQSATHNRLTSKASSTPPKSSSGSPAISTNGICRDRISSNLPTVEQPLYNEPAPRLRDPRELHNNNSHTTTAATTATTTTSTTTTPTTTTSTATTPSPSPSPNCVKRVTLAEQLIYNLPSAGLMSPNSDSPVPKSCLRKRVTGNESRSRPTGVASPTLLGPALTTTRVQCPQIASSRVNSEPLLGVVSPARVGHTHSTGYTPSDTYDVPPATPTVHSRVTFTDSGIYNVPTNTVTKASGSYDTAVNSDPAIDMRAAIRHPVTPTSQPTPRLLETPATPEARDSTSTEIYDVPGGLTSNASRISVDATPTAPLPRPSSSNGDSLSPSERSQVNSALSEGADSGISEVYSADFGF